MSKEKSKIIKKNQNIVWQKQTFPLSSGDPKPQVGNHWSETWGPIYAEHKENMNKQKTADTWRLINLSGVCIIAAQAADLSGWIWLRGLSIVAV